MEAPSSGLKAPWWQVVQFTLGTSPCGPSRLAGNTPFRLSRKLALTSRTMRMPYQALTRCGVDWLQFEKARVLWQ